MDEKVSVHLTMQGKLQGVGFRRFAKETAGVMNLDGWIRDVSDGTVEALVYGYTQALTAYQSALFSMGQRFRLDTISSREARSVPSFGFRQRQARVVESTNEMSREHFMDMVSVLYERPGAAELPVDLAQRITDTIHAKAKNFYQLRLEDFSGRRKGYNRAQLAKMLEHADTRQISHSMLRRMERDGLAVNRAVSFHDLMMQESEERRIGLPVRSWWLDQKLDAYRLADKLNIRYPRNDGEVYAFADIEKPSSPLVIKPVKSTGSRGVTLFYADNDILIVRGLVHFTSWESYREHVMTRLLDDQAPPPKIRDRWILEELVLEDTVNKVPARDLKFFCFYGQVGLVLEMVRTDKVKYCTWTKGGKLVPDLEGMPTDKEESWAGEGVTPEQILEVEEISRHIPVPFMRIDMLRSEEGLVLGEMTPRPGQWDIISRPWDRYLGEEYVKARARLIEDLMHGKRFDPFLSLSESEPWA